MKKFLALIATLTLTACGPGFQVLNGPNVPNVPTPPVVDSNVYFPVATATINVNSYGQIAALAKKKHMSIASLLISEAMADVAQGSATVNVTYTNPSATTFTINTAAFGTGMTVTGTTLNMGNITVSGLDDNTLKVCVGVGAPGNKCNRLYIRVFTLGTAAGGISGIAGFINKTDVANPYGIDVLAGSVLTPIGFNASAIAASVTNAATIYTYTIPTATNRARLSNLAIPTIPVTADLSNAGNGNYEMNLVVQYALGYQ